MPRRLALLIIFVKCITIQRRFPVRFNKNDVVRGRVQTTTTQVRNVIFPPKVYVIFFMSKTVLWDLSLGLLVRARSAMVHCWCVHQRNRTEVVVILTIDRSPHSPFKLYFTSDGEWVFVFYILYSNPVLEWLGAALYDRSNAYATLEWTFAVVHIMPPSTKTNYYSPLLCQTHHFSKHMVQEWIYHLYCATYIRYFHFFSHETHCQLGKGRLRCAATSCRVLHFYRAKIPQS